MATDSRWTMTEFVFGGLGARRRDRRLVRPVSWTVWFRMTSTQAYAADTWALGLCVLHLLTGDAPYVIPCVIPPCHTMPCHTMPYIALHLASCILHFALHCIFHCIAWHSHSRYEELLDGARAPVALRRALGAAWLGKRAQPEYDSVVAELLIRDRSFS